MQSPPRRRKSSFFSRYKVELIDDRENMDTNDDSPSKALKMEVNREEVIANHTLEMKKEISDWKNFYHQIQFQSKNMEKAKKDTIIECHNVLSEDDLNFIKNKPNIQNIGNKINELAEKFEIVDRRTRRLNEIIQNRNRKGCDRIHEIKLHLCKHLLNYDDIDHLSRSDDSANYSMESEESFQE